MAYIPPNPNGQATSANSAPVVVASDQSNLPTNTKQLNGVTVSVGNGTTDTGSQRVTLSSDSTGQVKLAAGANAIGSISNTGFAANQGTAAAITAGWPMIGGELADTTGTFTNATQTTSVTSTSFDGYSTVIVSINGTYGTATGVFEISDDGGTTWYSVNAARTDGSAIETGYTSLTNTNRMWTLSVSGADQFRVRSTAVASGTANIRLSIESMPTPEAASVNAYQTTGTNLHVVTDATSTTAVTQATGTNLHAVIDSGTITTVGAVTAITNALPAGANIIGKAGIDQTTLGTTNNVTTSGFDGTNYQKTKALTDGTTNVVQSASTATASNVSGSATNVTLLSANAARKGGSIFNDSTALLYVKFGTTASTTSFKVILSASAYFEIPAGYTGRIDGIWASATGTARIDEET